MSDFDFEMTADGSKASAWIDRLERDLNRLEGQALITKMRLNDMIGGNDTLTRSIVNARRATTEQNDQLKRQTDLLQRINGPIDAHKADLQALDALYRMNKIDAEQYAATLGKLTSEFHKSQGIASVGPKSGGMGGALGGLRGAATMVGVSIGANEVGELANEYQNLENRLRYLAGGDAEKTAAMFERVQQSAKETRADLGATTEAFVRMSLATKEMGLTQNQVFTLTERLNKAITLSGATSAEATAGMIQLSQGLASGALRGDELRSVLEQLPAVADVIAQGMGVTRGQLRELGKDGKITAEVIVDSFSKMGAQIDADFGNTLPTIAQGMVAFKNEMIIAVGEFNKATGASELFGRALSVVTDGIKVVLQIGGGLVSIIKEIGDAIPGTQLNLGAFAGFIAGGPLGAAIGSGIQTLGEFVGAWDDLGGAIQNVFKIDEEYARLRGAIALATLKGAEAVKKAYLEMTEYTIRIQLGAKAAEAFVAALDRAEVAADSWNAAAPKTIGLVDRINQGITIGQALWGKLTDKQKAHKAVLSDEEKLLREIQGPTNELMKKLALLEVLFAKGKISVEEYNGALDKWLDRSDEIDRAMLKHDFDSMLKGTGIGTDQGLEGIKSQTDKLVDDLTKFKADVDKAIKDQLEADTKARHEKLTRDWHARLDEYEKETRARAELMAQAWEPVGQALSRVFTTGSFGLHQFAEDMEKMLSDLAIKILMTTLLMRGLGLNAGYTNALGGDAGLGKLLGFATGGRLMVGGSGGTDSQVVAFRATPGEEVTIRTQQQQARDAMARSVPSGGGGPTIVNNVFDRRGLLPVIRTTDGRNEILNVIRENPGAVRSALQRSK